MKRFSTHLLNWILNNKFRFVLYQGHTWRSYPLCNRYIQHSLFFDDRETINLYFCERSYQIKRAISSSWNDSHWPDCLNLTAWFSYHVVPLWLHTCSTGLPRRTAIPLFTNHNMTTCQSTRGHQERTKNPCQQSLYNNWSNINFLKKVVGFGFMAYQPFVGYITLNPFLCKEFYFQQFMMLRSDQ